MVLLLSAGLFQNGLCQKIPLKKMVSNSLDPDQTLTCPDLSLNYLLSLRLSAGNKSHP